MNNNTNILTDEEVKEIVDLMDQYTVQIADAWTSGQLKDYSDSMRSTVYDWLIANRDSEQFKHITDAYKGVLVANESISESKLSDIFSPLTVYDITSRDNVAMLREDKDKNICVVKKRRNRYQISTFETKI